MVSQLAPRSWQPQVYTRDAFGNQVPRMPREPWAAPAGSWDGAGSSGRPPHMPLGSSVVHLPQSAPESQPLRPPPEYLFSAHPSAYSSVCQPFCYLETVFVSLHLLFSRRTLPLPCFFPIQGILRVPLSRGAEGPLCFQTIPECWKGCRPPGRGTLSSSRQWPQPWFIWDCNSEKTSVALCDSVF